MPSAPPLQGSASQSVVNLRNLKRQRWSFGRWRDSLLAFLVGSVIVFVFSFAVADVDLWGHVRFGLDFWDTGQVVRLDTYSYTAGNTPWINHEWLAEVLFGGMYRLAGAAGLLGLKVIVVLLIFGGAYGHLRSRDLSALTALTLLLAVGYLFWGGLGTIRPHMFTYLCFVGLLVSLMKAEHGMVQWLWVLPPLFAAWTNLHGGFLAGVGILYGWAVLRLGEACLRRRSLKSLLAPPERTIVLSVAASSLATLLNPYGYRLVAFLLRTATVARPEITEWHAIQIQSALGLVYVVAMAISLSALALSRRRRSVSQLAVFGVAAILPVAAVRHVPLFAVSVLVICGEHIADVWHQLLSARPGHDVAALGNWLRVPLLTAMAAGSLALIVSSFPRFKCIHVDRTFFPLEAVSVLSAAGISGNAAVEFNWGEYVLWHLAPSVRVSVDGRRETVYAKDVYVKSLSFVYGTGEWDALLKDYPADLALVGRDTPARNLLELDPTWVIAYEDSVSVIAVPVGSPLLSRIVSTRAQAHPDAIDGCFP